jgi:hypothetical protein
MENKNISDVSDSKQPKELNKNELSIDNKRNLIKRIEAAKNPFIEESHNRSLEVLNKLNQLSLVTPNEVALLKEAEKFIMDCYVDVPSHRTLIQKNVGVLTDKRFSTPDAKFWQCKKECEVQFEELFESYINYQSIMVDIKEVLYNQELLKQKISMSEDDNEIITLNFNIERVNLKIQHLNMKMKKLEKEIKYRISEIADWFQIAEQWKPKMKFDEHTYYKHELETLVLTLKSYMSDCKQKGDSKSYNMFKDQYDTLQRIVNERVKKES